MPRQKDLKRLVRARMAKTGESYTAARAKLVARRPVRTSPTITSHAFGSQGLPATDSGRPPAPDYAALAGTSDAAIKRSTGCTWERWVYALDRRGASQMSHGQIATLVRDKYKVGSWWAQTVTVGYERIKGLRAKGQRRDGSYEATRSRTFGVPVQTLFDAWSDAGLRRRWLDGRIGRVRTKIAPRSIRLDGGDGTIVAVGFTAKGPAKSSVAIQHSKLRDAKAAADLKAYWGERLTALGSVLSARQ